MSQFFRSATFLFLRMVYVLIALIASVWVVGFVFYLSFSKGYPNNTIDKFLDRKYSQTFYAIKSLVKAEDNNTPWKQIDFASLGRCFVGDKSKIRLDAQIGGAAIDDEAFQIDHPKIYRIISNTSALYTDIGFKTFLAQRDVEVSRTTTTRFAIILIILGFANTIASALNSNDHISKDERRTKVIKFLSISLPAGITAVTAFATTLAPTDILGRKSQLVYNLMIIDAEFRNALESAPCPLSDTDSGALEARLADIRLRYTAIVANSEFQTGSVSGETQQKPKS